MRRSKRMRCPDGRRTGERSWKEEEEEEEEKERSVETHKRPKRDSRSSERDRRAGQFHHYRTYERKKLTRDAIFSRWLLSDGPEEAECAVLFGNVVMTADCIVSTGATKDLGGWNTQIAWHQRPLSSHGVMTGERLTKTYSRRTMRGTETDIGTITANPRLDTVAEISSDRGTTTAVHTL
ncbi:hypothetical protein Baya_4066 [Bagarius yarrelli]|uniref:Uncharacterized protein n=1 Tax=Bagarius yarrelli TaxID=175774 RepID=A0A556TXH2_BAGYA|nr:hypothetical protein Baya_4066 [Bagarius yarrelli]